MIKLTLAEKIAAKKAELRANIPAPKATRSLAEILAEKKAAAASKLLDLVPKENLSSAVRDEDFDRIANLGTELDSNPEVAFASSGLSETFSLSIQLNAQQLEASDLALSGQSYCLIGAAGTGKTTTQRSVAKTLLDSGKLGTSTFKVQGSGDLVQAPSIAFIAYTRRASANLRRAIHKDSDLAKAFEFNVMTAHALLEFKPDFFYDEIKQKETMRFTPARDAYNKLDITHLVIEEASMIGLDLWAQIFDALPSGVQIIFIGDINQLPPVFGPSILNYALTQLPVVQLLKGYRTAEDSEILANAHLMLAGNSELVWNSTDFRAIEGKNHIEVGEARMSQAVGQLLKTIWQANDYDPEQDILLSPFNKNDLGTDVLNKYVAQFLGDARGAIVHEVLAGFEKHYLAVGDRVMVNRQDAVITKIARNGRYMGKAFRPASDQLNRFGLYSPSAAALGEALEGELLGYADFSLEALEDTERKQQASHIIDVEIEDSGESYSIDSAGDLNGQNFQLGYALTVHKAQGCEWRKVFLVLHKCHAVMTYRELLYTAVTRSRECFTLIGKKARTAKAIESPRIKGNTLHDKIAFFNANLDLTRQVHLIP